MNGKSMIDYHDFTAKGTPQAERKKLNVGDIWINAAECSSCGEVVRSRNRHDFRYCKCGKIAVDGGSNYCKRLGEGFIDRSEMFEDCGEVA